MSPRSTTTGRRGKAKTLCGCGTPTRDGAYVCDRCIASMGDDLTELLPTSSDRVELHRLTHVSADGVESCPWPRPRAQEPGLWDNLQSVIAGERGIDYRTLGSSGGSTEKGLVATGIVLPEQASKRARRLHRVLLRLVMDCITRNVPGPAGAPDFDSVPAMAAWLITRLDGIALHPGFTSSARDLSKAVDGARWSVMPLPGRQWLGACGMPGCDGSMFARRDETFATCNSCEAWVEARIRRDWLIAELEDRLCTAAEIADLYDPDPRVRPAIRKRVNQWASRGRLLGWPRLCDWTPGLCGWPAPDHGHNLTGSPDLVFRFGDAFDLLIAHDNDTNPARST